MVMDVREVEWQFDALDLRPVERWLGNPASWGVDAISAVDAGSVRQVDLYFDTDDQRFYRAGYALRIRRVGRRAGAQATLKSLESTPGGDGGLQNRREVSELLQRPQVAVLPSAVGPVGERVRAVAGRKPLLPLFEVRTLRHSFSLVGDGFPSAEIALDETAIHPPAGGSPARFRRVEIEVPESAVPALGRFVEELRAACGLQPAGLSKYEAGLLAADLRAPRPESFGSTAIDPDAPIGAVALTVLRRHFSALLAHEPGTRLGDDIEELHDMRVASRRLRAALSLFADVLPTSVVDLREELGWIGQSLGAVRDLDVQLEQLDEWLAEIAEADREALGALRGLLEEQRATARAAMLETLDSRRYESVVSRFGRALRARQPTRSDPASLPALVVAPDLIDSRFRPFSKGAKLISPDAPPYEYHRLRIRTKRLRYTLEFLGDLYPGQTRPLIKRLVAVQDILGLHQDADVAIDRLRRLAAEHGRELQPETIFAMGEVAERYRQSMVELRAQFRPAYRQVEGKRWKSFQQAIEERRPAPPEPAPDASADQGEISAQGAA